MQIMQEIPAFTRQINPLSRQVIPTIRQVTAIHPAGNRDQPAGKLNHLPFDPRKSLFSLLFFSGMLLKMLRMELTKCIYFLHSGIITENNLQD